MLDADQVRRVLRDAARGCFADLFAEQVDVAVIEVSPDGPTDVQLRARRGCGLRRLDTHRMSYTHTARLDEGGLAELGAGEHPRAPGPAPAPSGIDPASSRIDPASSGIDTAALHRFAADTLDAVTREGAVVTARVAARAVHQRVLIANSDGGWATDDRRYYSVRVDAVARRGETVARARRTQAATTLPGLIVAGTGHRVAREAAGAALTRLDAVDPPTGELTVILGPGRPATLFHEAIGHALEADVADHPAAAYHGAAGTRVAAPEVTVIDDPAPAGEPALYAVDDEGEPARPAVLIDAGVMGERILDRRTARLAGCAPNGHARRLSYQYPPLPRMTTTYVAAGSTPPGDIVADTPDGLLVTSVSGGDTDMGGGRFTLHVDEAYLVRGGRVGAPVRGAVVTGYGPDVLRSIDAVGDDLDFVHLSFVCNKLEQFPLLVSVGQPTLRLRSLAVRSA